MNPPSSPAPGWLWRGVGLVGLVCLLFPVVALCTRVSWSSLPATLAGSSDLLRVTLGSAALATVISTVLGVGVGLSLRKAGRLAPLVRLVVYLPLALPPVVAGLALTAAFGRKGLLSPLLDATGFHFAFAFAGVVLAHVFVSTPFVVATIDQALRQLDPAICDSAAKVGLSAGKIRRHIVFPALAPAIVTGAALACARSLGEFGTTLTFAGSAPGVTQTLPIGIYLEREVDQHSAYTLAALLIILAIAALSLAGLPLLRRRPAPPRAVAYEPIDLGTLGRLTQPDEDPKPITGPGFSAPAGTVTGVIGKNGAGKTTLMNTLVNTLAAPTPATTTTARRTPARLAVAMVTQHPALPTTTTAAGALTMVTGSASRTQELLRAAGLSALAHMRVPELSGGQAAQVALLRGLATRPAALILDEPFAAVDVRRTAAWIQFFRDVAGQRTTLLVSHSPATITELASQCITVEGGRVVRCGPPEHCASGQGASTSRANTSRANTSRSATVVEVAADSRTVTLVLDSPQGLAAGNRVVLEETAAPDRKA